MYARNDGPAALPVYIQVSELLMRDIAAGRLTDGQRLPPERKLAASHKITVGTLRKALDVLARKGLLERIQGSGNYIRTGPEVRSIYSMFRLELLDGGGLPTAAFLDVRLCDKPADLPAFGTSAQATRMRRLRMLNHTPVAVEEIWLDADAGLIGAADVSDSLYHAYQLRLGLWITRAEDSVTIGTTPDWAPAAFGPAVGAVTGYIQRLSWGQAEMPVEYSRTWFDADRARYVQRLK